MTRKTIKLQKNNDKRDWEDLEWITEFYEFMQGENPKSIGGGPMTLTKDQAYRIIWYLQEHLPVFPDWIEKCDVCGDLYDAYNSGYYSEQGNEHGNHFCDGCDHLAPIENED